MSDSNGVQAITDKINADAHAFADELTATAKADADAVLADFEEQAAAASQKALADAKARAAATAARAVSQGDMDKRRMLLATRQSSIEAAFSAAFQKMCGLPAKDRALLMVKNAVRHQSADAEYIFNAADRDTVGKTVVETVSALFAKREVTGELAGDTTGLCPDGRPFAATLAAATGSFAGGFILRQGDVESNCTFEVLVGQVRETLEKETSTLLFGES